MTAEHPVSAHRLELIRDAARLHRQQLIGIRELYAVIEADDRAALRDQIAQALAAFDLPYFSHQRRYETADVVLAVLPEPVDRAAVRDETVLDLGRDLLHDGLDAFLRRLVGPQHAARILSEATAPTRAAAIHHVADAVLADREYFDAHGPRVAAWLRRKAEAQQDLQQP